MTLVVVPGQKEGTAVIRLKIDNKDETNEIATEPSPAGLFGF